MNNHDPIADLCAWLRAKYARHGEIEDRDAADALERLAATERLLQACVRHETARAERAEAERDAANGRVRATDNMRKQMIDRAERAEAERDALREVVQKLEAELKGTQAALDTACKRNRQLRGKA